MRIQRLSTPLGIRTLGGALMIASVGLAWLYLATRQPLSNGTLFTTIPLFILGAVFVARAEHIAVRWSKTSYAQNSKTWSALQIGVGIAFIFAALLFILSQY